MKYYQMTYDMDNENLIHICKRVKNGRCKMIFTTFPLVEKNVTFKFLKSRWKEIPLEKYIEYKLKYGF